LHHRAPKRQSGSDTKPYGGIDIADSRHTFFDDFLNFSLKRILDPIDDKARTFAANDPDMVNRIEKALRTRDILGRSEVRSDDLHRLNELCWGNSMGADQSNTSARVSSRVR